MDIKQGKFIHSFIFVVLQHIFIPKPKAVKGYNCAKERK